MENEQEKILTHTIIESILASNYISPSIWHFYRQFQAQSNHTITWCLKKKKKSSSSGGLTLDYTKIWDVLRLLTEELWLLWWYFWSGALLLCWHCLHSDCCVYIVTAVFTLRLCWLTAVMTLWLLYWICLVFIVTSALTFFFLCRLWQLCWLRDCLLAF